MSLVEKRGKVRPLRSQVSGRLPPVAELEVGEMFINHADRGMGAKTESGTLIDFYGLNKNIRDLIESGDAYVEKSGTVNAVTHNIGFEEISDSAFITIGDESNVSPLITLIGDTTITVDSTSTSNKIVKLHIIKPETLTDEVIITWSGVSAWLSDGGLPPTFGSAGSLKRSLIVVLILSNGVAVGNTIYNSENPVTGSGGSVYWGEIKGNIADQADLNNMIDSLDDVYLKKENDTATDLTVSGTLNIT